ncbi:hypothetical protein K0B03_04130 [Patescibacteria group bacterium]|nr:hypothetical protein [Patescibacteria group bacterium]
MTQNLKVEVKLLWKNIKLINNGIKINNVKKEENSFYSWNDLSYFYTYTKINPLFGFLFEKIVEDDFFIKSNDNKLQKIKVGIADVDRVRLS